VGGTGTFDFSTLSTVNTLVLTALQCGAYEVAFPSLVYVDSLSLTNFNGSLSAPHLSDVVDLFINGTFAMFASLWQTLLQ
jgi:hypothetical protein